MEPLGALGPDQLVFVLEACALNFDVPTPAVLHVSIAPFGRLDINRSPPRKRDSTGNARERATPASFFTVPRPVDLKQAEPNRETRDVILATQI